MARSFIAALNSANLGKLSDAVAHLWLRLQQLLPALHSEYVQVLVFLVVPLALLLTVLLVDLKVGQRFFEEGGYFTYRPSVAVRCAYALAIAALLVNVFVSRHPHWITFAADLLAMLELLRTFPRRFTLAPDGIRWRGITGPVLLPWEHIFYFAKHRSVFGAESKLVGDAGQTLVISSLVFPGWEQISRRISLSLNQRHLLPSSIAPRSPLETLHRLLVPACLFIVLFDGKVPGLN